MKIAYYISDLLRLKSLVWSLTKRELSSRFRGSLLGSLWAVLQPIAVVSIFYYVLVIIFKTRWSDSNSSNGDYIVGMFIGLLIYNLFAETISRSTTSMTSNINYVKKIVFPITILPVVQLCFASINYLIGMVVLIIFGYFWGLLTLSYCWILIPFCVAPVLMWALGLSWITSALNVYFRDTNVIVPLLLQATMFLSPVFYNTDRLTPGAKAALSWSPLTIPITELRRIFMGDHSADFAQLLFPTITGAVVLVLGFWLFRKTKVGFADVL